MDPILVTGGTGTLGRHVLRRLRNAGHHIRVFTRQPRKDEKGVSFARGDLLSGIGVDAAVAGVATIIHCAGSGKGDDTATRNLVEAAARIGRPHLVYISVVGADRVPVIGPIDRMMFGYFAMKRRAEQIVANSALPWTILRATQFHDLVLLVLENLIKLPIVPVPSGFSFQPIDSDEVAGHLVELALKPPSGLVPEIAGPRVYAASELAREYLHAIDKRRTLVPIRLPGSAAHALRAGANLAPAQAVGRRTWEEFLASRLPPSTHVHPGARTVTPH
jgi:uncharacterized protein YbjT (DUF2867 family)